MSLLSRIDEAMAGHGRGSVLLGLWLTACAVERSGPSEGSCPEATASCELASTSDAQAPDPSSTCGDGIVEGDEACDGGERCTSSCTKTARLVFLTSTRQDGALGSVAAADELCQELARDAELEGEFMAWISDGTTGPVDRFVHSEVPYLVRSVVESEPLVIAADWADHRNTTSCAQQFRLLCFEQ